METWKLEVLKNLCEQKILSFNTGKLRDYWDAFGWNIIKVHYHIHNYKEAIKKYEDYKKDKSMVTEPNDFWQECYDSTAMEIEALIGALNQAVDILAQLINLIVLEEEFEEWDVKLYKIIKRIKDEKIELIFNSLKKLDFISTDCDYSFLYVRSFCNTIKHIKLVDADYRLHIDYTGGGKVQQGVWFKEFNYNGNTFKAIWGQEIIDKYANNIVDIINEVGLSINEYLELLPTLT